MSRDHSADRRETDGWIASLVSAIVTAVSALPYLEIFVKQGSFLERLQAASAVFFMPGLFLSMVFSGNVHDGSLEAGALLNFLGYALFVYSLLRWRRRRKSLKGVRDGRY